MISGGYLSLPEGEEKVLHQGSLNHLQDLTAFLGPSYCISRGHLEKLCRRASEQEIDPARVQGETDPSRMMEGLYIKIEENGVLEGRLKYVRSGFLATVRTGKIQCLKKS
jgi:hypothetical protein